MKNISLGYTGGRRSGISSQYILGNGYRGFNPVLKRFMSQDNMSPFGPGGEHGYAYCQGDQINQTDLSGHGPLIDFMVLAFFGVSRRSAAVDTSVTMESVFRDAALSRERGLIVSDTLQMALPEEMVASQGENLTSNMLSLQKFDFEIDNHQNIYIKSRPGHKQIKIKPIFHQDGHFKKLKFYDVDTGMRIDKNKAWKPTNIAYSYAYENSLQRSGVLQLAQENYTSLRQAVHPARRPLPPVPTAQPALNIPGLEFNPSQEALWAVRYSDAPTRSRNFFH